MINIIEPHADDAFLSLGGFIERWIKKARTQVRIITVYSGTRKRANDAKAYADAVGALWLGLGAKERHGDGKPGEGAAALKEWLKEVSAHVICCLAVKHPDHLEVRQAYDRYYGGIKGQYYLDQPYGAVQSNGERINDLLCGATVVAYMKPHVRKYRHIPLFKDQGKFFHFNPVEKLKGNVELIVERETK